MKYYWNANDSYTFNLLLLSYLSFFFLSFLFLHFFLLFYERVLLLIVYIIIFALAKHIEPNFYCLKLLPWNLPRT